MIRKAQARELRHGGWHRVKVITWFVVYVVPLVVAVILGVSVG
jgi:hypothetical protein